MSAFLDWVLVSRVRVAGIILVWICFCMALSYGAALAGHPTSLWMWRDILGLIAS